MWKWILARLGEDSTRAAVGQLGLLVVLAAVAFGVDMDALLTQAEAYTARIVAMLGAVIVAAVQVQRILTPDAPPPEAQAVLKAAELLGEAARAPPPGAPNLVLSSKEAARMLGRQ
ncbi:MULTISPECIES: hypothetical protein [Roseomonadaceae]|uniref:Holin n=1 Tax=Falsiroseomonas oleicola TaxID=2801474 RepID=A0ABS6H5P9_9PROT|nr:hypothetical protein [Roseomonas oleicola]MBU8544009.1 hypothetical protein [Roseomonas oleicola]